MKKSILRKITKDALINWDYEHTTMEEKERAAEERLATMENPEVGQPIYNDVVYGSVESAVEGLKKVLGLDDQTVEQMKTDIVTKESISPEVADQISKALSYEKLLDVLSTIHDGWVRENGNKFEARPKNYQFAPLELLPFKEAVADLLFIKPILEAAGIEIDMKELEETFLHRQNDFITDHEIHSKEDLKAKLQSGAEFYPALEDVKTNKGNKEGPKYLITELLKDEELVSKMASQVEEKSGMVYIEAIYLKALAMVKKCFLELRKTETSTIRLVPNQENRMIYASNGNRAYYYDEARDANTGRSYTFISYAADPIRGKRIIPRKMGFYHHIWAEDASSIWQLRGDHKVGFKMTRMVRDSKGLSVCEAYVLDRNGTVTKLLRDEKTGQETRTTISYEEFEEYMTAKLTELFREDPRNLGDGSGNGNGEGR